MFGKIRRIISNTQQLEEKDLLHHALSNEAIQAELESLNKKQLLSGLGSDGQLLPRYVDDPYFKSIPAALRYQAWKARISPNKSKPVGVMDLFITGQFHSTIKAENKAVEIVMKSESDIASDVQRKTSNKALGISKESIGVVLPKIKALVVKDARKRIFA